MSIAFVLSGGASLGAVQVGMLQALAERGIQPDMVLGASVGAVNAGWVAGDPTLSNLDDLRSIWTSLRTRDVFPLRPLSGLLGFVGRRDALVPATGLRALLTRHLRFERLEDAAIPLLVVATELTSGREIVLRTGNAVDAVLASAAVPGVFPPVPIDGRTLVDGGIVNNTPISHAVGAGASPIYVLPTGYACALERAPTSALAVMLQAIALLIQQRLATEAHSLRGRVDLRVIPPLCPLAVSPADFSRADELIDRAYEATCRWLADEAAHAARDQSLDLAFHDHAT